MKIDLPKLAAPARRALKSARINTLKDLCNYTEEEVADLHGMGTHAMNIIKSTMHERGLSFKSEDE